MVYFRHCLSSLATLYCTYVHVLRLDTAPTTVSQPVSPPRLDRCTRRPRAFPRPTTTGTHPVSSTTYAIPISESDVKPTWPKTWSRIEVPVKDTRRASGLFRSWKERPTTCRRACRSNDTRPIKSRLELSTTGTRKSPFQVNGTPRAPLVYIDS